MNLLTIGTLGVRLFLYLKQHGYLEPDAEGYGPTVTRALERLGVMFGVGPDARAVVENAAEVLALPRCGVPDTLRDPEARTCAWPHREITVHCGIGSIGGLTAEQVGEAYWNAVQSWAAVCGLSFKLVETQRANIYSLPGKLGGRGGVLAWSYLPCGASESTNLEQRYDVAEPWGDYGQQYLQGTIAHEVGHALGLDHSSRGNLMQPFAEQGLYLPQRGDTAEVVKRYGKPTTPTDPKPPTDPTTPPTTPTDPPAGNELVLASNVRIKAGRWDVILRPR